MCGITGYIGKTNGLPFIIQGLKRLEYRGYDSAGISYIENSKIKTYKKKGTIHILEKNIPGNINSTALIGHTRWATHGEPSDNNSHPHNDCNNNLSIVHNGVIENYSILKAKLLEEGHKFTSDTDSEILAHLIEKCYDNDLLSAVRESLRYLEGPYGLVILSAKEPDKIIAVRNGSPLVLGIGEDAMYVASDVNALAAYTRNVIYLEDRELAVLTANSYRTYHFESGEIQKTIDKIDWDLVEMEKKGFKDFMEKEIFEQPESIGKTMKGRILKEFATSKLDGLNMRTSELEQIKEIHFVACGTSLHAAMIGAMWLENYVRIPCRCEIASEFRYRNPVVRADTLYFAISQSGETKDTIGAMQEIKIKGGKVYGICNVAGSTIARLSDGGVYLHAGPEIAVASTKAFTSQLAVLALFTLLIGRSRNLSPSVGMQWISEFEALSSNMDKILAQMDHIKSIAQKAKNYKNFLFLGRGLHYPIALEGALKLKEITYIHAEGYSAAELKHGPISLLDKDMPVMFIIPKDELYDKVFSNLQEVKARTCKVFCIATEGDTRVKEMADDVIYIPESREMFTPFLTVVPLQLLAYYVAKLLGKPVDQPRHLAKSVTVE
ncbi:MAG: glutamine--fructose-6-phosphate transaminase (isomerizing) [Candidatus Coatesbacteria bacterium]|nr:glutamine--fructose-6-phosphate transaminase (isomerizing) [Candidatus Coatesbacteria bacterium]